MGSQFPRGCRPGTGVKALSLLRGGGWAKPQQLLAEGEQHVQRLRVRKQHPVNLVELKRAIYRLGCYRRGLYGCAHLWVEGGFERVEAGKKGPLGDEGDLNEDSVERGQTSGLFKGGCVGARVTVWERVWGR